MMRKKLIAFIVAIATLVCGAVMLSGCGEAEIIYTLSEDGSHYIVSVSGSTSALEEVEILSEYEGLPVTEIADRGFFGCSNIRSVVIPDSITKIGNSAFAYCTKLKSVTLSENLTAIPYGIFGSCSSLKTVDIPSSVTTLESFAFMYSSLTSITIPATVENIGTYCFYCSYDLETVDIRCEITTLPYGTFYNCEGLKTVILPATITEIKGYEEIEVTDEEGETTTSTYYGAFGFGAISAGSSYVVFQIEVETIYFRGTQEQWDAVTIGENNYGIADSQIVCDYND